MDALRNYYREKYQHDSSMMGIVALSVDTPFSPLIDGFDAMVLLITERNYPASAIVHYIRDDLRVQERRLDVRSLEQGIAGGENRSYVQWILQGEILVDRELYVEGLKRKLMDFPTSLREQKLFYEFTLFLRSYLHSKQYIQEDHVLDAYSSILEALHHWARIAIIEAGHHPEMTVWSHVRKINPGIYKLYEELTSSSETIEQRVRLVVLACEFSVMSKMEKCCVLMTRILRSRPEPWSADELRAHPELRGLHVELGLLLNKMVSKSLIREIVSSADPELLSLELRYTCA